MKSPENVAFLKFVLVSRFEKISKWPNENFYFFEWLEKNWWISLQELKLMTEIEIEVNLCRKWDWSWVYLTGIEMRSKLRMFVSNWDRSWVYSSGFEIEVVWIEIKKLTFQLVAVIKRYSFKSYYRYLYVNGIRKQNADSNYSLQIPLTICGFELHFTDPLTVAESATAQFNLTHVSLFVRGFYKLFWIPQIRWRIPQNRLFLERFWTVQCLRYLFAESKQQRRSKKSNNVVDCATNLVWACCRIHLQCTEWTVWPLNIHYFFHDALFKFFLTTKVLANCFSVMVYLEELFVTQDLAFLEILLSKEKK